MTVLSSEGYAPNAFARWALGLLLAVTVTLGLFWSMHRLIATPGGVLDKALRVSPVDIVRVEQEKPLERMRVTPKKPPPPVPPPPNPSPLKSPRIVPDTLKQPIATVNVAPDINLSPEGFSLGISDSDYLPLVKVSPAYPRRALSRGIEGWVMLEFTITEHGGVKDVRVVDSKPKSKIFHKAALDAALRWKYKPRIVAGKPVLVQGVKHKITFKIKD